MGQSARRDNRIFIDALGKPTLTNFLGLVSCLVLAAPIVCLEEASHVRNDDLNAPRWTGRRYLPTAGYQLTAAKEPKQTTVTGTVVALGGRVIRDDDACRQLMVVQTTGRGNDKLKRKYLLVPRNYDCNAGDFTNEMFQNKRKWRFPLVRGSDCDRTFEQIKDMPFVHPPGVFGSVPWMKFVPGNDGEKMSLTQKLLCYEINGELKPAK